MKELMKAFGTLVLLSYCMQSLAVTVTLQSVKDNTLYEGVHHSNSVGGMFAGSNGLGQTRRGLMAFDLSSIPSGAVINSATLTLQAIFESTANFSSIPPTEEWSIYRLTTDWGESGTSSIGSLTGSGGGGGAPHNADNDLEGDATWYESFHGASSNFSGTDWVDGGEFVAVASATSPRGSGGSAIDWSSAGLLQDVKDWVDGTEPNYGWLVKGPEGTISKVIKFGTKETEPVSTAPGLHVDYTVLNTAPVIDSTEKLTADENVTYSYVFEASDPDGDTLTLSAPTLPTWLAFTPGTGILIGMPGDGDIGVHAVVLRATDDGAGALSTDQSFDITVTEANVAPVIDSEASVLVVENEIYSYIFTASDANGADTLSFSAPVLPSWLSFTIGAPGSALLTGVPEDVSRGVPHSVTLRVEDDGLGELSAEQSFEIIVSAAPSSSSVDWLLSLLMIGLLSMFRARRQVSN